MRILFSGLPLDAISTSMTINAPAATLLMYQLVAEEQVFPGSMLSSTIQNDVLKEYIAHRTYIYPPTSRRLRLSRRTPPGNREV
jgi:methylmalonyl-CoA mutase N-terminal domain/subunit